MDRGEAGIVGGVMTVEARFGGGRSEAAGLMLAVVKIDSAAPRGVYSAGAIFLGIGRFYFGTSASGLAREGHVYLIMCMG